MGDVAADDQGGDETTNGGECIDGNETTEGPEGKVEEQDQDLEANYYRSVQRWDAYCG